MDRREPDGAYSHLVNVIQLVDKPFQVTAFVTVTVSKGVNQQLIGNVSSLLVVPSIRIGGDVCPLGNRLLLACCLFDGYLFVD